MFFRKFQCCFDIDIDIDVEIMYSWKEERVFVMTLLFCTYYVFVSCMTVRSGKKKIYFYEQLMYKSSAYLVYFPRHTPQ